MEGRFWKQSRVRKSKPALVHRPREKKQLSSVFRGVDDFRFHRNKRHPEPLVDPVTKEAAGVYLSLSL